MGGLLHKNHDWRGAKKNSKKKEGRREKRKKEGTGGKAYSVDRLVASYQRKRVKNVTRRIHAPAIPVLGERGG